MIRYEDRRLREGLLRADCFLLEVDGVSAAGFVRCRGLDAAFDVLEYREGGLDGVRLFRDRRRSGKLRLERGLTRSRSLWQWFERGDPRSASVVLLDPSGQESARWTLERAWPSAWRGPSLTADATAVAIEGIEIVYEEIRWAES